MKKALLALLIMLAVLIPALVACTGNNPGGNDGTTTGVQVPEEKTFDLTGYKVIRGFKPTPTSELIKGIGELRNSIQENLGLDLRYEDDYLEDGDSEDNHPKEIVIGNTSRTATAEARKELTDGSRFIIKTVGDRIVILGTSDDETLKGVKYFNEHFIKNGSDGKFKYTDSLFYMSDATPIINLLKDGETEFKIIYMDGLDNKINLSPSDKNYAYDRRDLEVEYSMSIADKLNGYAGQKSTFKIENDWVPTGTEPDPNAFEIIVGRSNRPELAKVKETLGYDEYTVCMEGNKLIVFGWTATTLKLAHEKALEIIRSIAIPDENRSYTLSLAQDFKFVGKYNGWLTDIPEFRSTKADYCYDANNGCLGIKFENTNVNEYNAFCDKLTAAGYKAVMENEAEKNVFKTFTNGKKMVHAYYVDYDKAVRLITSQSETVLPNTQPQEIKNKICDMSLTQLGLNYNADNFGMCYIVTLEDGSFIIYDGGGSKGDDYVRLYNILEKLNKRSDGIHIAAWVITHLHWDHHSVFRQFITAYKSKISLELVVTNAVNENEMYNGWNIDKAGDTTIPGLVEATGAKWLKPHTGQYFYIRNVKCEVLYTHEDLFPTPMVYFNNTTTVTRLYLNGQTMLMLGDVQAVGCNVMVPMYGNYLKSDIVQVAHHGEIGATRDLYVKAAPTYLVWPASINRFNEQTAGTNSGDFYLVDYYLKTNKNILEIIVADQKTKTMPIPYTKGSSSLME